MAVKFDGSGKASVKLVGKKVVAVVTAKAKVKAKVLGREVTVLSTSHKLELSKKLTDLSPCADVEDDGGSLLVKGRLCYRGADVCFENGKVYVRYKSKKYKVADVPKVCVPV